MKLEYLPEGSDDCPLIRIYEGTIREYKDLVVGIEKLANNTQLSFFVNELSGYIPIDGIKLEFIVSDTNKGVKRVSRKNFTCSLTREGWLKVKELVEPFLNERKNRFQWLDETSNISLLLSDVGAW